MSIYTKMTALRVSPINAKFADPFDNSVTCDSVNNAVRLIAQPAALGYDFVRWLNVFTEIVKESSRDSTAFNANVTFAVGNIFVN